LKFKEIVSEIRKNPLELAKTNELIQEYILENKIKTSCWSLRLLWMIQEKYFREELENQTIDCLENLENLVNIGDTKNKND